MKPQMRTVTTTAFVAAAFACCVGARAFQASEQPSAASAENGRRLFMTYYCYSCHGTEGHGGAGPRVVVGATPDAMIRYVRKPTGGNMPAYTRKSISDAELRDIHAYLRSIPASPSAPTIELLRR
jgi:ubiquinol-cytochrome c reductase cytochrome c subunit